MTIDDLEIYEVDGHGRTFYEHVAMTAKQTSQYNKSQYEFHEMPGVYWDAGNTALTIGQTYIVRLTSKPKSPGPRTQPGAMYLDIREATPTGTPPAPQAPQSGSQGQQGPVSRAVVEAPVNRRGQVEWKDGPTEEIRTPPAKDAVQERIEKGMAFNMACTLMAGGKLDYGEEWDADTVVATIRTWRDRLLEEVIHVEPHFCMEHKKARIQTPKGGWFHPHVEESDQSLWSCVESMGLIARNRPEYDPSIDDPVI